MLRGFRVVFCHLVKIVRLALKTFIHMKINFTHNVHFNVTQMFF